MFCRNPTKCYAQLGPDIQWSESFLSADQVFCVYLAKDEAIIHRHAQLSGARKSARRLTLQLSRSCRRMERALHLDGREWGSCRCPLGR
jgi:hypothetical protein